MIKSHDCEGFEGATTGEWNRVGPNETSSMVTKKKIMHHQIVKIVDIDFSFEGGRAGGRALTSVNEKETRNNL